MSLSIDKRQFSQARKFIQGTVKAAEKAQFRAVNRVAEKFRTAASKAIRDQVRLPAAYVNENLTVSQKATPAKPEAVISGAVRPVRLARYGAKQLARSAKKAKGDPLRSIPSGKKQAGVSVAVSRKASRQKMRGAFFLPLLNVDAMGVFVRTGPGKKDIKHLVGPSVDQVFRGVRRDFKPEISKELVKEYRAQLNYAMQKGGR